MNIKFWLNGIQRQEEIDPGMLLIDFLREKGCYSVKRGCETANCGLCTVLMDEKPILSCSMLAARIDGKKIVTLEGLQKEAEEFGNFLANEGAGRRADQGISGRKSVQMLRFCLSDSKHSEISEL